MEVKLSSERHGAAIDFSRRIEARSNLVSSRIILALDLDYRKDTSRLLQDASVILKKTGKYLCAVKINYHLILPLSLRELTKLNERLSSLGLSSIADIKLNDISNTNRIASEYLWAAGFSAIIANPFVGYSGALDVLLRESRSRGGGVILLGYMSHRGAEESYGLELNRGRIMYQILLERAKKWYADGVIMGSTRPEKIKEARAILGRRVKIFSPGSGAQGGDAIVSLKSGADYLIFGRTIIESKDSESEAKKIYESQLAWLKSR